MKTTLLTAALLSVALQAQTPMAFQPPSWGVAGPKIEGAQTGPVTGHPLSGRELRKTTQTLGDGTLVENTDTSWFYRDAAGRTRAESKDRVEIFDPVSQIEYDLSPGKKTYRKFLFKPGTTSFTVAVVRGTSWTSTGTSSGKQPSGITADLGRQMINGIWAKGAKVTETVPVGAFGNNREISIINERWFSDELQVMLKSSNSDPRFGLNVYELTDISQANPNAALFAPPQDYKLVVKE